jgi:purine-binding chemotaxis protein CheW
MPERYDPGFIEQVQFVVSLAAESARGQPWQLALAVNRVAQPVNLACEDVVWRGERSKRPWLLGTVKSHMCALLDVDVIGQMLTQPAGF